MKNQFLRTSIALACVIGLVGCGGDDANLLLRVGISGVNKDGLTIRNNGGAALAVAANSSIFDFPDLIPSDTDYNVEVVTSPSNAVCSVQNGKGKTGQFSPNNIAVVCIINMYNIKGTVTNLKNEGLIVINGSERVTIPANAATFTLTKFGTDGKPTSGQVGDGYPYGLAIFQQPAGQSCTLTNGTGTMGAADVTNVAIACN
jgi:hypothetical protein